MRNGDVAVQPVEIVQTDDITMSESLAALDAFRHDTVAMASGEPVTFTKAKKSVYSWMRGGLNRQMLIPHLREIVAGAVSYATAEHARTPGHQMIYAAGNVVLNGQPVSVRLILEDVGDSRLRQYQIEGFEVTAPTASKHQPDGIRKSEAAEAATIRIVNDVVADFKADARLFQSESTSYEAGALSVELQGEKERQTISVAGEAPGSLRARSASDARLIISDVVDAFKALPEGAFPLFQNEGAADGGPISITAEDVIALLENGTSGNSIKDIAIGVGMHEQWARGFEQYLMEGKAPSVELRSAFERFRAWLVSVYKRLTGLNVQISDDLRGVFDRMLATDEQIAEARADPNAPGCWSVCANGCWKNGRRST